MINVSVASLKNPEKEGFLTKQGGVVKNWKKRWFVLKDYNLYYFKSKDEKEANGVIDIEGCNIKQAYKATWKKYSFEIETKERSYFVYADNNEDADSWMAAIAKAASPNKQKQNKKGTEVTLNVKGICCDRCEEKIKNIIGNKMGSDLYELKAQDEILKLFVTEKVTAEVIITSLEDSGFIAYI